MCFTVERKLCFCICMFLQPCEGWDVFGIGLLMSHISLKLLVNSAMFESIHLLKTKDNSLHEEPIHLHIWRYSLPIVLLFLALALFVELCQTFSVTDNRLILLFIHSFPKHLCQLLFWLLKVS